MTTCTTSTSCYDSKEYDKCIKSCGDNCGDCSKKLMGEDTIWQCNGSKCVNVYCKDASDCQKLHGDPVTGQWIAIDGLCSVMGCGVNSDCVNSFGACTRCKDGVCVNKSCTTDAECPEGTVCIGDVCGIPEPESSWSVILILIMLIIVALLAVGIYFAYTKIKALRG